MPEIADIPVEVGIAGTRTEADAVADIAEAAVEAMEVEPGKLLVSPRGQVVTDLARYAERPRSKGRRGASRRTAVACAVRQTFEATSSVDFESAFRLQDGQRRLVYKETTGARAGDGGQMEVPDTFTLRLAPFQGTEPVVVIARLRYRINGGDLRLSYELDRPEEVIREAMVKIVDAVNEATGIEPYAGSAPTPLR